MMESELFPIRNRIAHDPSKFATAMRFKSSGELIPSGQEIPIDQISFETSYWIHVSNEEALRGKSEKEGARPLGAAELKVHRQAVRAVVKRLEEFHTATLRGYLHPTPEPLKQPEPVRLEIGRKNPRTTVLPVSRGEL